MAPKMLPGLSLSERPDGEQIKRFRLPHCPNHPKQYRDFHQTLVRLTTRRCGDLAPDREKRRLNFLFCGADECGELVRDESGVDTRTGIVHMRTVVKHLARLVPMRHVVLQVLSQIKYWGVRLCSHLAHYRIEAILGPHISPFGSH